MNPAIIILILCMSFIFWGVGIHTILTNRYNGMKVFAKYWENMYKEAITQRNSAENQVERLLSLKKSRTLNEIVGD